MDEYIRTNDNDEERKIVKYVLPTNTTIIAKSAFILTLEATIFGII